MLSHPARFERVAIPDGLVIQIWRRVDGTIAMAFQPPNAFQASPSPAGLTLRIGGWPMARSPDPAVPFAFKTMPSPARLTTHKTGALPTTRTPT